LDETTVLVDFGAGTGTFALVAAAFCKRVVAVDVSPAMLSVLRDRAERMGLTNVECSQAGFLTYTHQGDPADFVYSRNALHHLPDFWKGLALTRIAAILRPGGVLRLLDLVYAFEPQEIGTRLEAWFSHAAKRAEDGWTRPEFEVHVREEYSTFNWLLEPMLEHAGFAIRDASFSDSRIYAAYTCVKR
jgi:SAM-dependent methyltransferase